MSLVLFFPVFRKLRALYTGSVGTTKTKKTGQSSKSKSGVCSRPTKDNNDKRAPSGQGKNRTRQRATDHTIGKETNVQEGQADRQTYVGL